MKKSGGKIKKLSCRFVEEIAVRAAVIGANTTCGFVLYQGKVPEQLKKYRKF